MAMVKNSCQRKQRHQKALPEKKQIFIGESLTATKEIQLLTFLRIWQILGDKKANPPVEPILPISRASFYAGIKAGIYPSPVKLSARVSAWRVEDIRELLEKMGQKK